MSQKPAKPKKQRHILRSIRVWTLRSIAVLTLAVFTGLRIAIALGLSVYKGYSDGFVSPEELGINRPSAGAQILDRNGRLLYRYVDDKDGLRYPVTMDKISS